MRTLARERVKLSTKLHSIKTVTLGDELIHYRRDIMNSSNLPSILMCDKGDYIERFNICLQELSKNILFYNKEIFTGFKLEKKFIVLPYHWSSIVIGSTKRLQIDFILAWSKPGKYNFKYENISVRLKHPDEYLRCMLDPNSNYNYNITRRIIQILERDIEKYKFNTSEMEVMSMLTNVDLY